MNLVAWLVGSTGTGVSPFIYQPEGSYMDSCSFLKTFKGMEV